MPVNPAATPADTRTRLVSLDVLRGMTMAAMVIVNNPGSWASVYSPLRHAEWHGCTPTDLIFPFFLFVVGVAMAMSAQPPRLPRVLRRTLCLFALGLALNASSSLVTGQFNLGELRIMGVLQRIALCYLAAALISRYMGVRAQAALAATLLIGYALALTGDLSPAGSVVGRVDRALLGTSHLYRGGPQDPEGLLSTLPAVVTVLAGLWSGLLVRRWLNSEARPSFAGLRGLPLLGAVSIFLGLAWAEWGGLPMNKALWTSSFVLFTGGWAAVLFWACVMLIEAKSPAYTPTVHSGARPFQILGVNAILLFVGSGLLARLLAAIRVDTSSGPQRLNTWLFEHLYAFWLPPQAASLGFALTMLALWWVVLWVCWRRGWALKV